MATYTPAMAGVKCHVSLRDITGGGWDATFDDSVMRGSCSITFTAVTPTPTLPGRTDYCAHGTFTATLVDSFDGPGTVMLTATF